MVGLLDVNVLVALAWPNHIHREVAHAWYQAHAALGTDAHLLALALRHKGRLVTFDSAVAALLPTAAPEAAVCVLGQPVS